MNRLVDLLTQAREAGLTVRVRSGRLVVTGPTSAEPLARAILARKSEVVGYIEGPPRPTVRPNECSAGVPRCGQPALLYLCGWRCTAHSPAVLDRQGAVA